MEPERILIIGGPGSGKSTLGRALAARLDLPVHELDLIARAGGGRAAMTSDEERRADVAAILASPRWVAEGVHLGWTQPLIEAAQLVVWLDHVTARQSSQRIVRRFIHQAITEARRRRGRERFARLRDYASRLRELAVSVPETRTYPRTELEAALRGSSATVVRCRSEADVDAFLAQLDGAVVTSRSGSRHGR